MSGWDAKTYEEIASPQARWAEQILERADFPAGAHVLDAGCGGGGVTRKLLDRGYRVTAVDGDPAMVEKAREVLPPEVPVLHRDLLELHLDEPVDGVFSCAVFHWVTDHERLFERLHAAIRPGGRLIAQCGGHGNLDRTLGVAGGRRGAWLFATAEDTERRLRDAGFSSVRAWLEPAPTVVPDMVTFAATVIFRTEPDPYAVARKVVEQVDAFDYVRLNMEATA